MRPKFICDNCEEKLKDKIEEDNTIYIIDNRAAHCGLMNHNNCPNYVVLCEECNDDWRDQLKDNEDWTSLMELDDMDYVKDFYNDFPKIKIEIEKLSKEKKKGL